MCIWIKYKTFLKLIFSRLKMGKIIFIFFLSTLLQCCSTITIHSKQSGKFTTAPTFQKSNNYYFWGLIGEYRFNVKEICNEKEVLQIQSQATLKNLLFSFITLGIYSPHSIKIWCNF